LVAAGTPDRETRATSGRLEARNFHFWFYLVLPEAKSDAGSGGNNPPWRARLVPSADRSGPWELLVFRLVMVFSSFFVVHCRWRQDSPDNTLCQSVFVSFVTIRLGLRLGLFRGGHEPSGGLQSLFCGRLGWQVGYLIYFISGGFAGGRCRGGCAKIFLIFWRFFPMRIGS